MVAKKNLVKGKKYVYFFGLNVKPKIMTYIGMDTSRKSFVEDVAKFEGSNRKIFSPRLTELFDPNRIKKDRARDMIKAVFKGR